MATVGRYSLARRIAGGGMADIYLGTQHGAAGFARPVVIKAILSAHSGDPHFRSMLVDEAHIAMSLTHSNIVQVLDLGVAAGRYYLILELVDGWDLDHLLRRAQAAQLPLSQPLALHITTEVCRALAYAHAKSRDGKPLGIIHRDISPHNVLVSDQGEVKLTDFGIATALDRREKTLTGVVKGTIGFMSPEQAAGATLDGRSDLFALGTLLYLLVTGARPFASDSELETLLRIKEARFTPPGDALPGLNAELAGLISRAMARESFDRFADAEQMLANLEHVQRTALEPAGATELKRWLAELSARDGDLPVSKQSMPPQEVSEDAILSVNAEATSPAASARPPSPSRPPPPPPADAPSSSARTVAWSLGAAALATAVTVAVVRPPRVVPVTKAVPAPGLAAARVDAGPAPMAPTATAAAVPPPPAPPTVERPVPPPEPSPKPVAPPPRDSVHPAPVELASASGDLSQAVSVKLTTTPPGAEVHIEHKAFGTTPTSIRFRPGVVFQVRFDLAGYQPVERRVYISNRRDQAVEVALQRTP